MYSKYSVSRKSVKTDEIKKRNNKDTIVIDGVEIPA